MKIVTQEMVSQRIADRWPNEPFEIMQYTRVSHPFQIKCLDCGKISSYSTFNNFITAKKEHWCICHQNSKQAKHLQNQEKIVQLVKGNPSKELLRFYRDDEQKKHRVQVKCLTCGQIIDKSYQSYLEHPDCPYCENRQLLNTEGVKVLLPPGFSLMEPYQDGHSKVLIKHDCGFIWKVTVRNLTSGRTGCPKCNRKRSKGEQKIGNWLNEQSIRFDEEKIFEWQSNPRARYDFYLPEFNLVIEYMGRQHYEEIEGYFRDTLAERQARDSQKRSEALQNGLDYLEISYLDFDKIETILKKWFNDYSERKQTQVSRKRKHPKR